MLKRISSEDLAEVRELAASGEAQRIRERARVKRAELARDVGVTQAALQRWEENDRTPSGAPAIAWLRLLRRLGECRAKRVRRFCDDASSWQWTRRRRREVAGIVSDVGAFSLEVGLTSSISLPLSAARPPWRRYASAITHAPPS
jgi:DNA-binding transcriptional regulator YiaG